MMTAMTASNTKLTRQQQDEAVLHALFSRIRYECMSEAAYLIEQLGAEGYGSLYIAAAVRDLAEK